MKKGIGNNEYHINKPTIVAILNDFFQYSSDQVVVDVEERIHSKRSVFVVTFTDKPSAQMTPRGQ